MTKNNQLWVEKYRPKTIEDFVLSDAQISLFKQMIETKNPVNMILYGPPGIGKTSLAKLIASQVTVHEDSVLFIPCATDGIVDTIRARVKPFCESIPMTANSLKVVILDELDSASMSNNQDNSFQKSLRNLIEMNSQDCRFIITANDKSKILPALISRCPIIELEFTKRNVLARLNKILELEGQITDNYGVQFALASLIREKYPDIREIITILQTNFDPNTIDKTQLNLVTIGKSKQAVLEKNKIIKDFSDAIYNETLLNPSYVIDTSWYAGFEDKYIKLLKKDSTIGSLGQFLSQVADNLFQNILAGKDNKALVKLDSLVCLTDRIIRIENAATDKLKALEFFAFYLTAKKLILYALKEKRKVFTK
jgi:DNA polymerase III delta prime subunit